MIRSPLFLVALLTAGCAATLPAELLSARRAYSDAASGPAATLVPADLHKAHEALVVAEAAFVDDPRGYHVKDLAYVAQRSSELAVALAATAAAGKTGAVADARYQATQDAIMLDTRAKLGATQSDLAASEATGAATAARLSDSETARALAESRAADALRALARLAAVKEESRGLVITLSGSVLFRTDESTLMPAAQTRLGEVATALLATPERSLIVEGHTDSQGADAYNLDLSQRRADAVRSFLVSRGYDAAHVRAVGIGEARAVSDNGTAEGRAENRRVEIIVSPQVTADN